MKTLRRRVEGGGAETDYIVSLFLVLNHLDMRFPMVIVYEFTWKCHRNCIKKVGMCFCRGHAERREGSNKLFNLLKGTGLGILGISRTLGGEGKQQEECCAKVERFGKTFASKQYVTRVEDRRNLPRLCHVVLLGGLGEVPALYGVSQQTGQRLSSGFP